MTPTHIRIFLTCWVIFSVHFATNMVREHFPAFSLVEHGTLKVDRYADFHPDIFIHTDGHAYIGNNVTASVVAALPLLVFDPILDALERYEKNRNAREGMPTTEYDTERHPNSRAFFSLAQREGLTLRFGASAAVTSVFLMAPLSALAVVLMFQILLYRNVPHDKAVLLALLFAFGTPVFFRAGVLNHNMMLMVTTFAAFYLLWVRPGTKPAASTGHRVAAGFLCGLGLALDYSGVIPLLVIFGYLIGARLKTAPLKTALLEAVPFVLGSVPPVLFLLYTQWAMFGNPFMPGQYWMPDVTDMKLYGEFRNPYSAEGFRGFTWPAPDLYFLNLFDPSYGMYVYGPLLLLGLVPTFFYNRDELILPRTERTFAAIFFLAFLTFCAANQFSRIQFNSGFRYLIPVVPIVFLAASDHLIRLRRVWLLLIAVPALLNSWVISMVREPVPVSWHEVLTHGIQFPWFNVLRMTVFQGHPMLQGPLIPLAVTLLTALTVAAIWRLGPRDTAPATATAAHP